MRDPYEVLGVQKTDSEAAIRSAYRKLAKTHHPDVNPGKPEAAERFKEISAAYDILSDKEKTLVRRAVADGEPELVFKGHEGWLTCVAYRPDGRQIAAKSPLTLAIGKEAFYRQAEMGLDDAYAYVSEVMTRNMLARDAAEGIDAFLAKRPPVWTGT